MVLHVNAMANTIINFNYIGGDTSKSIRRKVATSTTVSNALIGSRLKGGLLVVNIVFLLSNDP